MTANLLSHVRKTTLTFGGAGMGLQLCNCCPVSASLTNRRVAPSAESSPQQGLDLGLFFHAENGAAREGPPRYLGTSEITQMGFFAVGKLISMYCRSIK